MKRLTASSISRPLVLCSYGMAALYAPPRGRSPADGAGRHCRGADYRGSIWAIRAARVFDGERFVARPTVLVDGPHIVAAGEPIPETVDVIDLPDSTVL